MSFTYGTSVCINASRYSRIDQFTFAIPPLESHVRRPICARAVKLLIKNYKTSTVPHPAWRGMSVGCAPVHTTEHHTSRAATLHQVRAMRRPSILGAAVPSCVATRSGSGGCAGCCC
jgi:hypothetical protein